MIDLPLKQFPRLTTRLEREDIADQYDLDTVHRLSYNESPLGPSPNVVAAIQADAVNLGIYPTMGDEKVRTKLAEVWGRGLNLDNFYTACSGFEALELAVRAFVQAGDEVIFCPPTFDRAYNRITTINEGVSAPVPLKADFSLDVDAILTTVSERTKLLILCNPNNPTGTVTPQGEMDRLVNNLPDHVVLVLDEVYFHFVTSPDYPDSVQYVLDNRPIILIHTFSKAYGLPGLRVGYGIASEEIANYIGGIKRGFHQNRLALAGCLAALEDQAHLQNNIETVLTGKQWLYGELDRLGVSYTPSETNFFIIQLEQDSQQVVNELHRFGVMVQAKNDEYFTNCLRLTVGTPAANRAFINGLEQIL